MDVLREISKISDFKPKHVIQKALFKLVKTGDYSRNEAEKELGKVYSKKQLSVAYSRLKYHLLDAVVNVSLIDVPKAYINRVRLWKRHLQIKILFLTGNRISAVRLAIQAINSAEKNHELDIIESLCKELMLHYTNNESSFSDYQKYRNKYEQVIKLSQDQKKVELVYQDLNISIKKNRPLEFIKDSFLELGQIAKTNNNYHFNNFYFLTKSLYFRTVGDEIEFIKNNKEAYNFFDKFDGEISYLDKYNFLSELIPYYIIKGNFTESANISKKCLQLPPISSFNWHRILIYQSFMGFYNNTPKIAYNSFKMAYSVKPKFTSKPIFEKWHIIKGYTAFFAKIQRVYIPDNIKHPDNPLHPNNKDNPAYNKDDKDLFKLGRFLNVEEKKDNHHQKANLLILELLHLLVDGNHKKYLEKLDKIEPYISTRFKAHEFKRTRYFLRMLKSVVKGNYHPVATQAHAKKQFDKLIAAKADLDVNVLNIEYVPYEILWDEVINILSKK